MKVLSHVTFREHLLAGDSPSSSLMRVIRQSRDPENATRFAGEIVMGGSRDPEQRGPLGHVTVLYSKPKPWISLLLKFFFAKLTIAIEVTL